jgi:hypothetical protein
MAVADESPPDLSLVTDCGLGADLARTALLKCMTGGWSSGGISCERGGGPPTCAGLELVVAPTLGSAFQ